MVCRARSHVASTTPEDDFGIGHHLLHTRISQTELPGFYKANARGRRGERSPVLHVRHETERARGLAAFLSDPGNRRRVAARGSESQISGAGGVLIRFKLPLADAY